MMTASLAAHAEAVTIQLKWVTQAQFAGYYVAAAKGYYKDAGLDVTILPGGPDINPQQVLAAEGASKQVLADLQALQGERDGLRAQALGSVGWWPDAYDRFTLAQQRLAALREQIATDSGLILDPWLETYLLMQLATQDAPRLQQELAA